MKTSLKKFIYSMKRTTEPAETDYTQKPCLKTFKASVQNPA